jgi:hypothetical protein
MTEKRLVILASVELWNVALKFRTELVGAEDGRYRVVDSEFETSSMRICVRA